MNQLDLFATSPAEPTTAQAAQERQSWEARQAPVARARANDPASSHEAAERMNRGTAKRHREIVIDLVWKFPGRTSKELAMLVDKPDKDDGVDRHEIARRLPEAEAAGEVHRKDGGKELTWHPGRKPE